MRRMPFGKYRGVLIADLPDDYIAWLHGLDDLREPLRSAIREEWVTRFEAPPPTRNDLSSELRGMVAEIISAGYRTLAKVHHPDTGGETRAMQLLGDAAAWLRAQARTG